MIKPEDIIMQIRANAPIFANRVHGTAELDAIDHQLKTDLAVPSAFYMSSVDSAEIGDVSQNVLEQDVQTNFGILLVVDNSVGRTGIVAVNGLPEIKAQVFASILNWTPDPLYSPIRYLGDRLADRDRGRLYWLMEFTYFWKLDGVTDGFDDTDNLPDLERVYTGWDMADPSIDGEGTDGQIDANDELENLHI